MTSDGLGDVRSRVAATTDSGPLPAMRREIDRLRGEIAELNQHLKGLSIHAARKRFYDWLDKTRLWAQPGCDVYQMMEEMVDMAAAYFRGDYQPARREKENG